MVLPPMVLQLVLCATEQPDYWSKLLT